MMIYGNATQKQIDYTRDLIEKCGYSQHEYENLAEWDIRDVSKLIDELKAELGCD